MNTTFNAYLFRKPEVNENQVITHPANAEKWKGEIDFGGNEHLDLPIVQLPVNLFLDDTSTHRSRQWMAFHCIQMQLAGRHIN